MVTLLNMEKVDILKHTLVPKHTILADDEKETLLNDLNISKFQLPSIYLKDAIVSLLNAKVGDVIKIEREGVLGCTTSFRRVI